MRCDFLQGLIAGIREYSYQDRLNELQDTYKYMLRYRIEGAKDPMQDQIYNNLIASSYEFADIVKHKALSVDSPLSYYSRRRMMQKELTNYDQLHKVLRNASLVKIETPPEPLRSCSKSNPPRSYYSIRSGPRILSIRKK